jgi:L-ascorbate metabolism protein UlaG (beta-lactamase superfamily)
VEVAGRRLGQVEPPHERAEAPVGAQGHPAALQPDQVGVTFVGHATLLVQVGGLAFLTDPVFTSHAGPFGSVGPRRVRPPGVPIEGLPPVSLVLISHNHYDHLQPSSLHQLRERFDPVFVAPLGAGALLRRHGLQRTIELDWWQQSAGPGGSVITCVPAQHFSARGLRDRNRTLWCGFVVEAAGATTYFAGDSGYCPHFREIAARWPHIDLALLPIGAYEPRWFMRPAHMNPAEALQAHRDLGARQSIAMHFGTFQLTDEGIDEPLRDLARALNETDVSRGPFRALRFGETAAVPLRLASVRG